MPRKSPKNEHKEIKIEAYSHAGKKRKNNPPVGLVSSQTDKLNGYTKYAHDPYIDPHLSWAGKQEGREVNVRNISLHVHERIDSTRVIRASPPLKRKVFVAMSGGVDSSVAAFLLKKQYDAIGVFMKFWKEKIPFNSENTCCSEESEAAARAVAAELNMPFYVVDCGKEFKKEVVDYFLSEYQAGRTPNPCIICNQQIKFGLMLKKAMEMGADYLASGHYVRHIKSKLLKAKDIKKDQSYFLWTLTQDKLRHFLFPIGDYTKDEVRKIARENNLPYYKKESFDVCFANGEISDFLKKYLKLKAGDIVTFDGQIIGRHEGLFLYTIGQRQGLKIGGNKISKGKPFYVAGYNLEKNQLIVVPDIKHPVLFKKELIMKNANWITSVIPDFSVIPVETGIQNPDSLDSRLRGNDREASGNEKIGRGNGKDRNYKKEITAKIRYGAKSAIVDRLEKLINNRYKVIFKEPQWAITPGQSIVFYAGDELLGGGVID